MKSSRTGNALPTGCTRTASENEREHSDSEDEATYKVTCPLRARRYADIVTGRERTGRPIGVADAQIAAICRDLGATLATRSTADFEETGIGLNSALDHASRSRRMANMTAIAAAASTTKMPVSMPWKAQYRLAG